MCPGTATAPPAQTTARLSSSQRPPTCRPDPSLAQPTRTTRATVNAMPRRFTLHTAGADEVVEALGRIDRAIIQLFALVGEGVAGATHSLLAGDREAARSLAESDEMIDTLYREVEQLVQRQLAQRATGPEELRYLVTVLRMLPDLERSGDLAEHVSRRAVRGLGVELSARARGHVEQMGEVASEMWRATADAYADRSPDVAEHVESLDDETGAPRATRGAGEAA